MASVCASGCIDETSEEVTPLPEAPPATEIAHLGHSPGILHHVGVVTTDGEARVLHPGVGSLRYLAASPTERRVAFGEHDGDWTLRVMSLDGGESHTVGDGVVAGPPIWSPDGAHLVYEARLDDGAANVYLLAPADGSAPSVLTPVSSQRDGCSDPAFSPDGREIVYATTGSIEVLTLATRTVRVVASGLDSPCKPQWSPSGALIAFTRDVGLAEPSLDVVSARGEAPRSLAALGSGHPARANPRWSPDSRSLIYVDVVGWPTAVVVLRVGLDGAPPEVLVDLNSGIGDGAGQPVWSPDGSAIAFTGFTSGTDVGVWDAATGTARYLGVEAFTIDGTSPQWVVPVE